MNSRIITSSPLVAMWPDTLEFTWLRATTLCSIGVRHASHVGSPANHLPHVKASIP
jgi:hypothetical protein